jgi:PIN domain nuclease of toxin-antitoxin system
VNASGRPIPFSDTDKTFILDTSAVLRFLDREAGGKRVFEILESRQRGRCLVVLSSLHWGELAGVLYRRFDARADQSHLADVLALGVEIIPVTGERAVRSAVLKVRLGIPYVDAFGVELAGDSPDHVLVTADFDAKPAANEVRIEFLPTK